MARSTMWKHRKFRHLTRLLGSRCLAAGVLECMWSYGYETAEDLLGKSVEEVEECCGWEGKGFKRGRCFDALLQAGWIDESPEGYRIHGLFEHCPQYVKRRRERTMASHNPVIGYAQVSTPYPTTNNPQPLREDAPQDGESGTEMTKDFLDFYDAYPKHEDKTDAWKAWKSLKGKRPPLGTLLSAIEQQKRGRKWREGYIKSPASWLRKGSWEDEVDNSNSFGEYNGPPKN